VAGGLQQQRGVCSAIERRTRRRITQRLHAQLCEPAGREMGTHKRGQHFPSAVGGGPEVALCVLAGAGQCLCKPQTRRLKQTGPVLAAVQGRQATQQTHGRHRFASQTNRHRRR
jgi:hypothetical protein